jgi:hypothetical protein
LFLAAAVVLIGQRAEAQTNFTAGNVSGQLTFNGAAVDANSNTSQLIFYIPNLTDTVNNPTGGYQIDNLAPGTYSLQLFTNAYLSQAASEITSQSVTIAAETTTTANFELASVAGEVSGSITVNGSPLSQPSISATSFNGSPYSDQQWTTGSDGSFNHFFPPGSYTANVGSAGGVLGSFSFVITAGQVTNLNTVAFETGNVAGQITFLGAPVDANSNTSQLVFYIPNLTDTVNNPRGGYEIDNLAPGTYSLQLFTNAYLSQAASEITSQQVTIQKHHRQRGHSQPAEHRRHHVQRRVVQRSAMDDRLRRLVQPLLPARQLHRQRRFVRRRVGDLQLHGHRGRGHQPGHRRLRHRQRRRAGHLPGRAGGREQQHLPAGVLHSQPHRHGEQPARRI